ncbi:KR domain-containing protein [Hirsutella rhossiliensis]|uniref:KR domain-containing protein n=1 Tax=Hirsutella rhossiliensis TaxID=111463 RepID=A0A9P8SM40_9HYPO|nr:KR domain-containing protein [Hirsutella rhossiliensis]KAH0967576.1 KR domain-containing protein [Hirsutella rhossiliensis]
MAKFDENCTFSSVDLTLLASKRPKIMSRVLVAVMDLLTKKVVKPIGPISTVGIGEVEAALRMLQSGKTSGKLIVSHTASNQKVKATHPSQTSYLPPDGTYVIIGGTGGVGKSLARRMVLRGARHVVLLSRCSAMTSELQQLIQDCHSEGASIHVRQCDASDGAQVSALVKELQGVLPAVRGVIHAAMVLKDILFEKMTFDEYQDVVRPKVDSAWNFHESLLDHPLDFFIVLSSVAGIIGNRGQAAYAAANTFLDAFALHRRRRGLAATSLNLTAISDVGYLTQDKGKQAEVMKNISGSSMSEQELLALVEAAIQGKVGTACDEQCITGLKFSNPAALPYYSSDRKFTYLRNEALVKVTQDTGPAELANLTISQKLSLASDSGQAQEIVTQGLQKKLGAILMVSDEVMAAQMETTAMTAFGLDSLTAIELRNWVGKELQAHLQVLELLTGGSLRDLAATVLKKTKISGVWSNRDQT